MAETPPFQPVRLEDYQPPAFQLDQVDLTIDLDPDCTRVVTRLTVRDNRAVPFELDGEGLELQWVKLDGDELDTKRVRYQNNCLQIKEAPDSFMLEVCSTVSPRSNPGEMGLFERRGILASECEPYGFRRISFFPDRPDVMTTYTVTLIGDRECYPVMLSNGNLVEQSELDDGKWQVSWHDPVPKPSYIFALFAGKFGRLRDWYETDSGRRIALNIYIEPHLVDQCDHAMASLKRALRWDERTYGFEYDLDLYNIVALVGHGNAMENKGLNLFAAESIVADKDTTLDVDFLVIERIIAHEVFHNWTGNRVTCRDWFQLCLKEGLTRFRDQTYDQSLAMDTIKRIWQVKALRRNQFPDDESPDAHAVRPRSYYTVENFYNSTVYDKGAEIIRMLYGMLGKKLFHKGMDLFIQRHDLRAVTLEDFLAAMADAANRNLEHFACWYDIEGRPRLSVEHHYRSETRQCELRFSQARSSGIPEPVVIPVAMGLLAESGGVLSFRLDPDSPPQISAVLEITDAAQVLTLYDVDGPPIPSLLRGFSAPISLEQGLSRKDLATLAAFDPDPFVGWDSIQRLYVSVIREVAVQRADGLPLQLDPMVLQSVRNMLSQADTDRGLAAELLDVTDEPNLSEGQAQIDLDGLMAGRRLLMSTLNHELHEELLDTYRRNHQKNPWSLSQESLGRRMLKNACLRLLASGSHNLPVSQDIIDLCFGQLTLSDCMTDRFAALTVLIDLQCPERDAAVDWAYEHWKAKPMLLNYWFMAQALGRTPDVIERLQMLPEHRAFDPTNTAQAMALYGSFFRQNREMFHDPSGAGYDWLAEMLLQVDRIRPSGTAWLMPQIKQWQRYDENRKNLMKAALERVAGTEGISKALYENISGALKVIPTTPN